MLMFATVKSHILTFRVHSLFRVSIWYSSLWSVVLLSCFWCFNEIFDAVEMEKNSEKLWKLKIKRKPLKKASSLGNHCSVDCSGKLWLKTYTGCHPRSNTSVFHLLQVSRYFYTHRILLLPHWKQYCTREMFKTLSFAKISIHEIRFLLARENKCTQKLVSLRYIVIQSHWIKDKITCYISQWLNDL